MYTAKLKVFILLSLISIGLFAQEKSVQKTFKNVKSIAIITSSGNCIVQKSDDNNINVEVIYSFDDENFEPRMQQRGSNLKLQENFEGTARGSSTWKIAIPENLELKFRSGSGNFKARNNKFQASGNSGSGNIILEGITGDIEFNTGSGNFSVKNYSGRFKGNAGSGNFLIRDAEGTLNANSGSGNIMVENAKATLSCNSGSGNVLGSGLGINGKSSFNAGSGNVKVVLAGTLRHDLQANSGSGDAEVDFHGSQITGEIVMKANKKNGKIVAPFTFDSEEEEKQGGQTILRKSKKFDDSGVMVRISTGSGEARVEK